MDKLYEGWKKGRSKEVCGNLCRRQEGHDRDKSGVDVQADMHDSQKNLSMAIPLNLTDGDEISYEANNYPHDMWLNYLAYERLKWLPKYLDGKPDNRNVQSTIEQNLS